MPFVMALMIEEVQIRITPWKDPIKPIPLCYRGNGRKKRGGQCPIYYLFTHEKPQLRKVGNLPSTDTTWPK